MDGFYSMTIAGLKRDLPICELNDDLDIAGFVILGDYELCEACARDLIKKGLPEHDYILTAEAKGIPLAHELARQLGEKKHLVTRKGLKVYMRDPIAVDVQSITTKKRQTMYLDRHDAELMRGKRILIADDVVSTGESLQALKQFVEKVGGIYVGCATILAEGDAKHMEDVIYLEELPLFFKNKK